MDPGSGGVLFAFVRFWSRRWTGADQARGRDVLVLEAIKAVAGRTATAPTVNEVAHELGLDQSGASRMITQAERQSLVTRHPARGVGTPTTVMITEAGATLLNQAHAWQDEVLRTMTAGWPAEDVRALVTLMGRLVEAQSGATPGPTGSA